MCNAHSSVKFNFSPKNLNIINKISFAKIDIGSVCLEVTK